MIPEKRFLRQPKRFWANVRLLSQHIGYTARSTKKGKKGDASIRVPSLAEVVDAFTAMDLASDHVCTSPTTLTPFGRILLDYFGYRAEVLNTQVNRNLMNGTEAKYEFDRLKRKLEPKCPIPMNKQKGDKKAPAFLSGIVNMIVEANADGLPCNYNPLELTTFTKDRQPIRTLARRVDGAFPSTVNPVALWEIKEYYYTTTFGSRVADGVYESLLDGLELENLREDENIDCRHYLIIDARDTWWNDGKSYLCRIIDMMHMGYVDEVLFGREVIERLPIVVRECVAITKLRMKSADAPVITPATTNN
jgi:hypothetical protein